VFLHVPRKWQMHTPSLLRFSGDWHRKLLGLPLIYIDNCIASKMLHLIPFTRLFLGQIKPL